MRYLISVMLIVSIMLTTTASPSFAAKKAAKKVTAKSAKKITGGAGVYISKLRYGRGITVTFSNLRTVWSITYMLSYETNGKPEGVVGTLSPGRKKSLSRQLLFGTCSSGICRYHTNVKNAYLEVTSVLKNGRETTRSYKIR